MTDFNSYMGNIDTDFFRELCLRNGELRYYKRNEFILREGEVGSFFGFIVIVGKLVVDSLIIIL